MQSHCFMVLQVSLLLRYFEARLIFIDKQSCLLLVDLYIEYHNKPHRLVVKHISIENRVDQFNPFLFRRYLDR